MSLVQVDLREGDMSWSDFQRQTRSNSEFRPHIADAYDVTNVLFSSGTTGKTALRGEASICCLTSLTRPSSASLSVEMLVIKGRILRLRIA